MFYFQKRIGFKNRIFSIWKFATMLKDSPNIGTGIHTTREDPRVLPMGHFLRKTKINELPQIVNILKGDMSIVGPRPLVDKTFEPYPDHVKKIIYNVKPGLTGIGSIVFRDEERLLSETVLEPQVFYKNHISPYKGELELWYQEHLSFRTDFMLIFLTAWVIVGRRVIWFIGCLGICRLGQKSYPLMFTDVKTLMDTDKILDYFCGLYYADD